MKLKPVFIVVFCLQLIACKEAVLHDLENTNSIIDKKVLDFDYLPTSTTQAVYHHNAYSFSYAEDFEQSEWVAYELKASDMKKVQYERPFFEIDEVVKTGAAHWRNYKKSGYNKGHLCPAGDRKVSYDLYEETFLTSNISPQKYEFNSGVWNRLEQKVRYWATKYDGLYVVTAGVLSDKLDTIGFEDVAVPKYFYKVLLTQDRKRMIGFLVPHQNSNKPLYEFVVPVDVIEKKTGIDFYPNLDDTLENTLELKSDYKDWAF